MLVYPMPKVKTLAWNQHPTNVRMVTSRTRTPLRARLIYPARCGEQCAIGVAFCDQLAPIGSPLGPLNTGRVTAGTCMVVQITHSDALPVEFNPTGASPVAAAVNSAYFALRW